MALSKKKLIEYLGWTESNEKDLDILFSINDATKQDAMLPMEYLLGKGIKVEEGQKYLKFLAAIASCNTYYKYAYKFYDDLFDAYHTFKYEDEELYNKILNLNNPVITNIVRRIEQLLSHAELEQIYIKDKQLHEVSMLLKDELPTILDSIRKLTNYKDEPADMLDRLKNINIGYIYTREKNIHKGLSFTKIQEIAKSTLDLLKQTCPNCECNDCPIYAFLSNGIKEIINKPSEKTAVSFLSSLQPILSSDRKCINKEIYNAILKLKKAVMDRGFVGYANGAYLEDKNEIILCLRNIYEYKGKKNISQVYAHEIFHVYHTICVKEAGGVWDAKEPKQRLAQESLAAYFENKYLDEMGFVPEEGWELCNLWQSHSLKCWDYAGAKYLMHYYKNGEVINYNDDSQFRLVFNESLKSLENASKIIEGGEKLEFKKL